MKREKEIMSMDRKKINVIKIDMNYIYIYIN